MCLRGLDDRDDTKVECYLLLLLLLKFCSKDFKIDNKKYLISSYGMNPNQYLSRLSEVSFKVFIQTLAHFQASPSTWQFSEECFLRQRGRTKKICTAD